MDMSKLSALTIIKSNPETTKAPGTEPNKIITNTGSNGSDASQNTPTIQVKILESKHDDLRRGKLSLKDFNKKILGTNPKLLDEITLGNKNIIEGFLQDTLMWYIRLKLLLSTGVPPEDWLDNLKHKSYRNHPLLDSIKIFETFSEGKTNGKLYNLNPKEASSLTKDFLQVFINDDALYPQYKITNEMVSYLHNERPGFINEIQVLFELYSKFYDTISNYLIEDKLIVGDNDNTGLTQSNPGAINSQSVTLSSLQPRFDMINRHIFYTLDSKLTRLPIGSSNVEYSGTDMDLNKLIPKDIIDPINIPIIDIKNSSKLNLLKRFENLNNWLINGIIQVQTSINRLNGLKPLTKEGYTRDLLDFSSQPATSNYDVWLVLRDTKAFLESLKGLVDGSSFLSGIPSGDMLSVLDTNY